MLGLALLFAGEDEPTRTAGVAVVAIMLAGLAAWEWLVARTYVALTPAGVELHQLGMQMRAAWPDVAELSVRRGREGFVVREPLEGAGAARFAALRNVGAFGAPLYDDEQRALLQERRFIPIEAFAWHLRYGTLAQQVARLAPHVRVADEPAVPARANAAGLAWAALLIALGLGLALATPDHAATAAAVVQALAAPFALLGSGINAVRSLRSRVFLVGGLFVALTFVTLGWTLVAWQQLAELLDS